MTVAEQLDTKGNVVTDIKATDVNANIEVGPEVARKVSPEAALLFNSSVVARPLMAPEVCSIHIKNTEYRYRWVNHDAQHGRWYQLRRAQGFTNATSDDVDVLGGDAVATKGEIRAGDLILMKIRADIYDAAMKWNMMKAQQWARDAKGGKYLEGASSDVMSDSVPRRASVSDEPFTRGNKAIPFVPVNPDSIVEDSISSGRVEAARESVKSLGKSRG